ncbi:hypothetical protein AGMMS49593_10290 [Endomicrobiia bacterium]|nr:hypothetical protein AGMMS49593_10290 [Endomicrobiia bacterium]
MSIEKIVKMMFEYFMAIPGHIYHLRHPMSVKVVEIDIKYLDILSLKTVTIHTIRLDIQCQQKLWTIDIGSVRRSINK